MKNIVLIGFMGTGKTIVGKQLAKRLGFNYLDIDREIEKNTGMTISEIFQTQGESRFRDMEAEAISATSGLSNTVISTGGGAVLRSENLRCLRENGILICLSAKPETIYERVRHSKSRPLLQTEDPLNTIRQLINQREPYYRQADMVVETDGLSPSQIVDEIINSIKGMKHGNS